VINKGVTYRRLDGSQVYRCSHGFEHPTGEYLAWVKRNWGNAEADRDGYHRCDGCCTVGIRATSTLPPAHTATKSATEKCPTCGQEVK
jgi:hypothetical protein